MLAKLADAVGRPFGYIWSPFFLVVTLLSGADPLSAQAPPGPEQAQTRIEEAVRALESNPRLKAIPRDRLRANAEFTVGNTLFVVLHELGHALIDDMYLYVLGREEDAADTFATTALLRFGGEFSQRVLEDAAKGWFYADKRDQARKRKLEFYDAHGLDQQRAYQIICLLLGSDAERFKKLADETKMPEERQTTCQTDNTVSWSWDTALKPHRRSPEQPKTEIKVTYGDAPQKDRLDIYADFLKATRLLETVSAVTSDRYAWSAPWTISAQTCGTSEAHWNHPTRTLVLCYEMPAEFSSLYREYGQDWKPSRVARAR